MGDDLAVFLLTSAWRDAPQGVELAFWAWSEAGPVKVVLTGQEAVTFVRRGVEARSDRRREVDLTDMHGHPVDALYFRSQRAMLDERDRLRAALTMPCESDLKPTDRFLMERFVTGGCVVEGGLRSERKGFLEVRDPRRVKGAEVRPRLRVAAFDIETDGKEGPLISIAVAREGRERVFLRGEGPAPEPWVSVHGSEETLLAAFLAHVAEDDPDVLAGWNVVEFDLRRLVERARALGLDLDLGRGGARAAALEPRSAGQPWVARIPGRAVLDGITTMRAATWSFESWSLDDVARQLLGRGKQIDRGADDSEERVDEIRRMWREDPAALAAYNLEDCRLVLEIFERARVVEFVVERQRLTGLPLDRAGGAVAAFDNLYLPRLHRHGHVAPDVGVGGGAAPTPGGHVMESEPGLFDNVVVLDFKSLYPSIIRTFRIDPMGLAFPGDDPVAGFDGASFARERHILPGLIETLWGARDEAKRRGSGPLSQAIKIQMNSFYGVLGTPACRFFSPRLASSITRRGHEILARSRELIEERGYRVLYGDTDSLFVLLGEGRSEGECEAVGRQLAADLTEQWRRRIEAEHRLPSALELEFETHYIRFFMPTLRGSEVGTKKRYAGTVRGEGGATRMVFKGLEAVRTDWTPLARRFQRELYRRVFEGEPFEAWARQIVDDLYAGRLDEELAYRKRLRRGPESYSRVLPPHVQAARMLGRPVRVVSYYVTTRGPEPAALLASPIDYDHYLERQLAPAADGLLHFLGTDLLTIAGRQMTLF